MAEVFDQDLYDYLDPKEPEPDIFEKSDDAYERNREKEREEE
jgi:hypothetical protein